MSYTPYRGTAGRRVRENDEGHSVNYQANPAQPAGKVMRARFFGKCIVSGAVINPGDMIAHHRGVGSRLICKGDQPPSKAAYVSDVIETSGGTFYRNKNGRCEDAPCCGCCTI